MFPPKIFLIPRPINSKEGDISLKVVPMLRNAPLKALPSPSNASLTIGILSPNRINPSAINIHPERENRTRRTPLRTANRPLVTVKIPLKLLDKVLTISNPENNFLKSMVKARRIIFPMSTKTDLIPANRPVPLSLVKNEEASTGASRAFFL